MNTKCSTDYVSCFTVHNKAEELDEAEAVSGEANGLNRTISATKAESLQTTLKEPKTSKKSLCDRICNLWLIRKIISFFKRLCRSKEVINSADARITDPVDKKIVTSVGESTIIPADKKAGNADEKNNKTTDSIVIHKQTDNGHAHVSGNIGAAEQEQVADKRCSDNESSVSAANEKHQVDTGAPARSPGSTTETLSSDARHDQENQESEVVHSAMQHETTWNDRVMESRFPADSDSSHNDAESDNREEASVQLPSSESVFNDNAENVYIDPQRRNLTIESAILSGSISPLSTITELSDENSLELENTDTNQAMSEKLVEFSMSRELSPNKAEAGMESGVEAKAEVDVRINIATETEDEIRERIDLASFEQHERECIEEENKTSRKHDAAWAWLGRCARESPPTTTFPRSLSMLELSAVSRCRKSKSVCDIVSECSSEFGSSVSGMPARVMIFREMAKQKKLYLQEHNQYKARMQRLGFGMAQASRF